MCESSITGGVWEYERVLYSESCDDYKIIFISRNVERFWSHLNLKRVIPACSMLLRKSDYIPLRFW